MKVICSENLFCDDDLCGGKIPHSPCSECNKCTKDKHASCIPIENMIETKFRGKVVYMKPELYEHYKEMKRR